jgi:hypothetical protein
MNLIVEITLLPHYEISAKDERLLAICDHCQDLGEIVVARITIPILDETISLCGECMRGMPTSHFVD